MQIGGHYAEIVAQKTADPDRGGHLILGYAHALALEVGRGVDVCVGADPNARMAKLARRIDRDRQHRVVTAGSAQQITGQRHLGGVELGVARHTPEDFLGIHAQERQVDPCRPHVAEDERQRAICRTTGERHPDSHLPDGRWLLAAAGASWTRPLLRQGRTEAPLRPSRAWVQEARERSPLVHCR